MKWIGFKILSYFVNALHQLHLTALEQWKLFEKLNKSYYLHIAPLVEIIMM
jgi:hypothetical protein